MKPRQEGWGFVVKAWRGVLLVQLGCREAIVVKINIVEGTYSVCVCVCVWRELHGSFN